MKSNRLSDHLILIAGALFMLLPLWLIFASSTHNPNTSELSHHGAGFCDW